MTTFETILTEIRGRVGLITLNRPQALNALNAQLTREVTAAFIASCAASGSLPSLIAVREPGLRADFTTRQVYVDGALLDPPLSTKQFDLLWFLYQNRGRVVSKDEIAAAVWPNAQGDVYDANIDRMISRVRSRIEPGSEDNPRFIHTVRGYGYQLEA